MLTDLLERFNTREKETHYLNHLRDMLHNLPEILFKDEKDVSFLHDVFCCLPYHSAIKWHQEVVGRNLKFDQT